MKTICNFNYTEWCNRQAAAITTTMRDPRTRPDAAFFLIRRTETEEGRLILASDYPPGMCPVVRLGTHTRWQTVPFSHLADLIYRACGNLPIIPATAWSDYQRPKSGVVTV